MKEITSFCVWFCYLSAILCSVSALKEWSELFKWKQMEFSNLPDSVPVINVEPPLSEIESQGLYSKTTYIPYNNLPVGLAIYKSRLFITIPRRRIGVPATLNVIHLDKLAKNDKSPKLTAYPNYDSNKIPSDLQPNPNQIISIYRPQVDECGRLWFIDTGFLEYPTKKIQVQRPSLWAIDLQTNRQILRYDIPPSVQDIGDGFISITIDTDKAACDKTFVYIPNMRTSTISVYSMKENRLWTIRHNTFRLEPREGDFMFSGIGFQWTDAVFSIALGPRLSTGYRSVFYHAMASLSEYYVNSAILQNETLATRSYHGSDFKYIGSRMPDTQSAMHTIDTKSKIMIHSEISKNSLGCWNMNHKFSTEQDVIAHNNETMIYPCDLKVDFNSYIWFMSNRIPVYIYGKLDVNDYNYRVFRIPVSDAVRGTKCENHNRNLDDVMNW